VKSRDVGGAFLVHTKTLVLANGSKASNTYKMVHLKEGRNCNDIFPNTRIVMAYLRNAKVVMTYIQ
jgi:hypothetical protein